LLTAAEHSIACDEPRKDNRSRLPGPQCAESIRIANNEALFARIDERVAQHTLLVNYLKLRYVKIRRQLELDDVMPKGHAKTHRVEIRVRYVYVVLMP